MKEKRKVSFLIRYDLKVMLDSISDENAGLLFKAAMDFAVTGEVSPLNEVIKPLFAKMRNDIEEDVNSYNSICQKNKEIRQQAIEKSNEKQRETTSVDERQRELTHKDMDMDMDKDKDKKKASTGVDGEKSIFSKPTLKDIKDFILSENIKNVDADNFFNYYEAVGWVIGKDRKPMKNWKSSIRTWSRTDRQKSSPVADITHFSKDYSKGF